MILLKDLLNFTPEQIGKAKIKFNKNNGYDDPIELYKSNPDVINKEWLYWRSQNKYFEVGQIAICLVRIRDDIWLLTTVDTVDSDYDVKNSVNNSGTPISEYQKYFGRTIIKFHKSFASQGRTYKDIMDHLEICQILPDTYDDDDFPGYDRVKLSYAQLKSILGRNKKDWIAALESQKAVYLITDKSNGKLYVGSATSATGMLLQRWSDYASDGHGGNKELKSIADAKGIDYIKDNFQYSILENYNSKVDDKIIRSRENWWKDILQTRRFGYNYN